MAKAVKVTNKSQGPRGAYRKGELVMAQPGETIEADDFNEDWFVKGKELPEIEPEVELSTLIADAVDGLDAENDEHWTGEGLPAVAVVSKLVRKSVTREQIEAACPDERRPDPEPE